MFNALFAEAAAAQQGGASAWIQFLPLILIFGVMMFFMMRSQKKQQQKRQEMLDKIVKGTRVLLQGGICGTVAEVKADTYLVEIADKVIVEVVKNGVAELAADAAAADPKKA